MPQRPRCEGACRRRAALRQIASIEVTDVLGEILDVLLGQRRGNAGHVASVVRAPLGLKILELLLDVLWPLAGDARDLVLTDVTAEVAHRTQHRIGGLA